MRQTYGPLDTEQVDLNEQAPPSGTFAAPTSGLEPELAPHHDGDLGVRPRHAGLSAIRLGCEC